MSGVRMFVWTLHNGIYIPSLEGVKILTVYINVRITGNNGYSPKDPTVGSCVIFEAVFCVLISLL